MDLDPYFQGRINLKWIFSTAYNSKLRLPEQELVVLVW